MGAQRHVLITQGTLFSIAGSEVVTYETAQYFAASGSRVTVATYGFSPSWAEAIEGLPNTTLIRFDDPALDQLLQDSPPDLAWIHHQIVPDYLLRNPESTFFVFHHMSAFQEQEFAISHRVESELASLVLFPSEEAKRAHVESGLLDEIDPDRMRVYGNPAPDSFRPDTPRTRSELGRLFVVSNHAPEELHQALKELPDSIEVVVRGRGFEGGDATLVTPEDIEGADAVVSIGKTVQYALVNGCPVYCYDHFGGPGWLSQDNVGLAQDNNFSGRGFGEKTASTIAEEIVEGFAPAAFTAERLSSSLGPELLMSHRLKTLLTEVDEKATTGLDDVDIRAHLALQQVMNGLTNAIEAKAQTAEYHEGLTQQLQTRELELVSQVEELTGTVKTLEVRQEEILSAFPIRVLRRARRLFQRSGN